MCAFGGSFIAVGVIVVVVVRANLACNTIRAGSLHVCGFEAETKSTCTVVSRDYGASGCYLPLRTDRSAPSMEKPCRITA